MFKRRFLVVAAVTVLVGFIPILAPFNASIDDIIFALLNL